jgi:hypothetical protein
MTMRFGFAVAALALGVTSAVAQIAPNERQEMGRSQQDLNELQRIERWDRDFSDRTSVDRYWDRRDRDLDWDRRGPYRGPVITFGAPGYFVRTLPPVVRVVRYGGLPCRITITRRVNYRGEIIETERRRCPGRPDVIIQRR